MDIIRKLPKMCDYSQESWVTLRKTQDNLYSLFSDWGYEIIETPIIEPTELFLRKSGGELASRMYTFDDPGGNKVSLRPEYTASVLRSVLEDDSSRLPVRLHYSGPVFRYDYDTARYRQYIQTGAEIIGTEGSSSDAEIIALAYESLTRIGITGHRIILGDVGIISGVLDTLELSARASDFVISRIDQLKNRNGLEQVMSEATRYGLILSDGDDQKDQCTPSTAVQNEAKLLLSEVINFSDTPIIGQRLPIEIIDRLINKMRKSDKPSNLRQALQISGEISKVQGYIGSSISSVENILKEHGMGISVLDNLKQLVKKLDGQDTIDISSVQLNFGLVRGLRYYTGMIFEIVCPDVFSPLAGGGRYDGLSKALGSNEAVPALGFAFNLEYILDIISNEKK